MITVLTGSNAYELSQDLRKRTAEFVKKYGESGVERIQGLQIQPESLPNLLTGVSLFAANRLVIIKNLSENKPVAEQFLKLLKSISSEVEVVLVEPVLDKRTALYKTLKREAELLEFGEPEEGFLVAWSQDRVKKLGGSLELGSARKLVRYVGLDQSRLKNEIDKLVAYDIKVTENSIEELVEKNAEETVFQLLDLVFSGQKSRALEILGALERAHEDPYQVASMLVWQTHILAIVHSAGTAPEAEIAKSAKLNPFVVRKTRALSNSVSRTKLSHILNEVSECDVKLKSTATDPWRVVEQTILSL